MVDLSILGVTPFLGSGPLGMSAIKIVQSLVIFYWRACLEEQAPPKKRI